jgi:hypothetical protein
MATPKVSSSRCETLKRLLYRTALVILFHEMSNNLRVGMGKEEVVTALLQFCFQISIIRDDAVMDNRETPIAAEMRVGVFLRHTSMGGSPCVRDA